MPMNHVVSEVANRRPLGEGTAPDSDGRPEGEPAPTTMNTPDGLPPYLHIQTLDRNSALMMAATVLTVFGFIQRYLR